MTTDKLLTALAEAYGADRHGRAYGYKDPKVYTLTGYHRGLDIRKQNATKTASVVTAVVSLSAGTIVYVGRPGKIHDLLGLTIVVDTGRKEGRYESHSHLVAPVVVVGDKVKAGQVLARNAAAGESPGSAWGGPHDHFTVTDHVDGAWQKRPEYDPAVFIQAALAAAATKPATVFVVSTKTKLRNKPKTGPGTVIKSLKTGQRLRVTGITGKYAIIARAGGRGAGYVWAARLTRETLTATQASPLRAEPSAKGKLLRTIPKGTKVKVIGAVKGSRVRARVGTVEGWAYRRHLK